MATREVVLNCGIGGFSLSEAAYAALGLTWDGYGYAHADDLGGRYRDDPELVAVVQRLGKAANGRCAQLGIATIPATIKWHIHEDETGEEWIDEDHRSWTAEPLE